MHRCISRLCHASYNLKRLISRKTPHRLDHQNLIQAMTDPNTPQSASDTDQAIDAASENPQVRLRVDEREMSTSYANAYRTHLTNEEVMIDFGLNMVVQPRQSPSDVAAGQGKSPEILFHSNDRIIMNYYTAKRVALTLGKAVRQYEQRFGELKLDANERVKPKG